MHFENKTFSAKLGDVLRSCSAVYASVEVNERDVLSKDYAQIINGFRNEAQLTTLLSNQQCREGTMELVFAQITELGFVGQVTISIDHDAIVNIDEFGNSVLRYYNSLAGKRNISNFEVMRAANGSVFKVVFVKHLATPVTANHIEETIDADRHYKQQEFITRYGAPDENTEQMIRDYKEAFGE